MVVVVMVVVMVAAVDNHCGCYGCGHDTCTGNHHDGDSSGYGDNRFEMF